jgi:hypothetical protein
VGRLPFAVGLFFRTLIIVVILVVVTWFLIVRFGGYQMTAADYGGTTISTVLFAYLVHLWLMPPDKLNRQDHSEENHPDEQRRT